MGFSLYTRNMNVVWLKIKKFECCSLDKRLYLNIYLHNPITRNMFKVKICRAERVIFTWGTMTRKLDEPFLGGDVNNWSTIIMFQRNNGYVVAIYTNGIKHNIQVFHIWYEKIYSFHHLDTYYVSMCFLMIQLPINNKRLKICWEFCIDFMKYMYCSDADQYLQNFLKNFYFMTFFIYTCVGHWLNVRSNVYMISI